MTVLARLAVCCAAATAVLASSAVLANDHFDPNCPHPTFIAERPAADPPGTWYAKWLKDAAAKSNAVCIDGTTPVVYVRPGNGTGASKWYIHHQGGGWCNDPNGCLERSQTPLGSTRNDTETMDLHGGYFDYRPFNNPYMYNWNMAYLRYCDGGSFSGNNATALVVQGRPLWFRGWSILNAAIDELLDHQGLANATDVIVSGCSAGGLATYLHADHWEQRLRPALGPAARIKAMPDSGFFPDYNGPPGYENRVKGIYGMMNNTAGLNPACLAQYPAQTGWKCFFAENVSPFIRTPTFALQSQYDIWQITSDLGTNDTAAVNAWGAKLVETIHSRLLDRNPANGIFLDSCYHHCQYWGHITIDGEVSPKAVNDWFEGTATKQVWFQNATYPCASCCS